MLKSKNYCTESKKLETEKHVEFASWYIFLKSRSLCGTQFQPKFRCSFFSRNLINLSIFFIHSFGKFWWLWPPSRHAPSWKFLQGNDPSIFGLDISSRKHNKLVGFLTHAKLRKKWLPTIVGTKGMIMVAQKRLLQKCFCIRWC